MSKEIANYREFAENLDGVSVRGFLHQPKEPNGDCLVLTHGAGSNSNSPLLISVADAFASSGLIVLRCDLPFRQVRPHGPPPRGSAEGDQRGLRAAVESMRRKTNARLFLGGHSYGGRQASMLVAAEPNLVEGLLLLSYPLHPPERPAELRTAHFPHLHTRALFVHGTRDGFGSIDEITAAVKLIPAQTKILPIAGAGHELMTRSNRDQLSKVVGEAFHSFFET